MSTEPAAPGHTASHSIGTGTFGEGLEGNIFHRLFRVVPGHDLDYVLEQSSRLMGCVYKLTHEASLEHDDTLVLAAYYLSGMAKALTEDVAMARMLGAEEGSQR
ncbi:DUF3077 domain-containing protein [Pseudomonas capeferrum]|uniref:DUF3077 domain-containing protein n=1 Tax=Pseudomonas capeferrum TaxID=1495066 RepID=UPI0015E38105|nr:DUF3077 domain-containing protein [Pseudomonas capeferrum]MBA1204441.1 DUF3077 domain-containing protein [Pseudomonas capeferrum]